MHRLIATAAALAMTAAACGGGGGSGGDDGPVDVGSGLSEVVGESQSAAPDADAAESGAGSDGEAPGAAGGAGPPPEDSPHPTTPTGEKIINTTVRKADGFNLQLTVDQAVGYEGDLIFDLVITNERNEAVWYEPGPAEGALVRDQSGQVVWRNGQCGGVTNSFGHVKLEPGKTTRLSFQYDRDGAGDESCALRTGRYDVIGQFFWCDTSKVSGEECQSLSKTASHPVPVRLEES